jgi:hypothetical protein
MAKDELLTLTTMKLNGCRKVRPKMTWSSFWQIFVLALLGLVVCPLFLFLCSAILVGVLAYHRH